jgi:putative DNA methylase
VLSSGGRKEYLRATAADLAAYEQATVELHRAVVSGEVTLPDLALEYGHNTRQAMGYGFKSWRDFFNDRQLLALGWLRKAILNLDDASAGRAMLTLFSGVLEFNNLFASYKGEGTGAVRHMFSHHILKPERMSIEANVWGTPKSSGSFSTLFSSRLLRAIEYREQPTEVNGRRGQPRQCSPAFTGRIEPHWPTNGIMAPRGIYLSCADSANTNLSDGSIDLVVTDPPFFDNVHYSELADFFFAWQQIDRVTTEIDFTNSSNSTTRRSAEVQDADEEKFAEKLQAVFRECHRVLRDDGLLVFTYHQSRHEGWASVAQAILGAGFVVVNSHPVKAEMSVATPKSQAKEPIQFDIILVCRKRTATSPSAPHTMSDALASARSKLQRLQNEGFTMSRNDRRIVLFGQLLTMLRVRSDFESIAHHVENTVDALPPNTPVQRPPTPQKLLFE